MSLIKTISKEAINDLPQVEFRGAIDLIEDNAQALAALRTLSTERVLGFDTETRPSFSVGEVYPVSLLQLATADHAYLFRLNKMPSFPQELADLLANPNIIKAGVAIHDDVKGLQKLKPFVAGGFVDLSVEAKKMGVTTFGLRALTAIFLGERLSKAAKLTKWDQRYLSEAQLHYAANDAVVGFKIFEKMEGLKRHG